MSDFEDAEESSEGDDDINNPDPLLEELFGPPVKKKKVSRKSNDDMNKLLPLLDGGEFAAFQKQAAILHISHQRDLKGNSYLHKLVHNCIKNGFSKEMERSLNFVLQEAPHLTEVVNAKGQTPIAIACHAAKDNSLIKHLIKANPNAVKLIDNEGNTPLHHFVRKVEECNISLQRCLKIINELIELGCDLQLENKKGQNVVCVVLARGDIRFIYVSEIAKVIFQLNPLLVSDTGVHTIKFIHKLSIEMLEFLVKLCPNEFSKTDSAGCNVTTHLIDHSCTKNLLLKLKVIFENVPDITVREQDLRVALIKQCNFEIIEYLLQVSPADINVNVVDRESGMTLLLQYGKSMKAVDLLLNRGANPNISDKKGHSVLCLAAKKKDPQLLMRLLEGGANPLVIIENGGKKMNCFEFHNFLLRNNNLLKHVMNLDIIKNSDLTESLIEFYMHCISIFYFKYSKDQMQDSVVTKLQIISNSNPRFLKVLYALQTNVVGNGHKFQVDSFGFLCFLQKFRDDVINRPEIPVGFMKILLDVGFKLSDTSEVCITSLTALLLAFKDQATFDQLQPMIAALILDAGVNIGSMALTNYPRFIKSIRYGSIDSIEAEFKIITQIPDALFLAFHHYEIELVRLLLPHWWGPPLGLLTFTLPYLERGFRTRYIRAGLEVHFLPIEEVGKRLHRFLPQLLAYGGIPHGTSLFINFDIKMKPMLEDIRNHVPESVWDIYQETISSPLKLKQLCKYTVRQLLADRASKKDTDLPTLLDQTVEPTLQFLVK